MKSTANSLRLSILLGAICIGVSLTMPVAHAQQPFYKGKRFTVLINFAAGGPADIESRDLRQASCQAHRRRSRAWSSRTWTAPAA